jgi:uncharacterized protein YprB with RNaseH-like and TPR domain
MELPQKYCRPDIVTSWHKAGRPTFSQWSIDVSKELSSAHNRPVNVTNRTLLGRVQRELKLMGNTITAYRYEAKKPIKKKPPVKPAPVYLNAAVFDIETSSLDALGHEGFLICTSILEMGNDKPETYALKFEDGGDDRNLLAVVVEALSKYEFLIGHNIAAFDFNWLNSRLMYHGMELPPAFMYYDTYQVARTLAIKSKRKSLAFLGDFFRLDTDDNEKTAIYPTAWSMVRSPDREDFDSMLAECVDHCEKDVKRNRDLFWAIYRYAMKVGQQSPWKRTKWR